MLGRASAASPRPRAHGGRASWVRPGEVPFALVAGNSPPCRSRARRCSGPDLALVARRRKGHRNESAPPRAAWISAAVQRVSPIPDLLAGTRSSRRRESSRWPLSPRTVTLAHGLNIGDRRIDEAGRSSPDCAEPDWDARSPTREGTVSPIADSASAPEYSDRPALHRDTSLTHSP